MKLLICPAGSVCGSRFCEHRVLHEESSNCAHPCNGSDATRCYPVLNYKLDFLLGLKPVDLTVKSAWDFL
jgi:hypothetical protein